jgi:phosphate transport system permease protein
MTWATWRKAKSAVFVGFCGLSIAVALVPLAFIFFFVVSEGVQALNVDFFTQMPKPVGEPGGGMANAIFGTLTIVGLGALFAIPTGIMSGVYLSEYAGTRLSSTVRFAADTLNGVPVDRHRRVRLHDRRPAGEAVQRARRRPGARHHDDPDHRAHHRGAAAPGARLDARGIAGARATRAQATFTVVLPAALPGILTGVVLALARIAGETAPLLFTSFNNRFFNTTLTQPMASLTVTVFTYAISPYEDWHRQAWAGALVLVAIVFFCSPARPRRHPPPRADARR